MVNVVDISDRRRYLDRLTHLADHDVLTGLANRRAFLECAESVYAHSCGSGEPLTLLMLDLDHFKSVNDRFGHLAGDRTLAEFAQAVKSQLRASDVAGRLGGEEFAVLLPATSLDEGRQVATRILHIEHVEDAIFAALIKVRRNDVCARSAQGAGAGVRATGGRRPAGGNRVGCRDLR